MHQLTLGTPGIERMYVPSFLMSESPDREPVRLGEAPNAMVANGQLPGAKNGGLIELGGEIWGVDHVAAVGRRNEHGQEEVVILGSDKSAVAVDDPDSNIGQPNQAGLIIFTNLREERVVVGALIARCNGWRRQEFQRMGMTSRKIGDVVIGVPSAWSRVQTQFRIHSTNDIEAIVRPITSR